MIADLRSSSVPKVSYLACNVASWREASRRKKHRVYFDERENRLFYDGQSIGASGGGATIRPRLPVYDYLNSMRASSAYSNHRFGLTGGARLRANKLLGSITAYHVVIYITMSGAAPCQRLSGIASLAQ